MPYIQNATLFLTSALIGFAIYIVLMRFWMQWVRADFRNEVGDFVIRATNPIVIPARRILPPIGTIDTATIALAYLICVIKITVIIQILGDRLGDNQIETWWYFLWGLGLLLRSSIYLFLAAIFISIIASWFARGTYHPILSVARTISEPILAPARRIIPAIAGLDLSPILVILFLNFSLRLFVDPILPSIF